MLLALSPFGPVARSNDTLVFSQRFETCCLDVAKVGKQICTAVIRSDKAKAFGFVEPFHCTCLLITHVTSFLKLKMGCARLAPEIKKKVTERNSNSAAIVMQ
jgi:hypothetical protein